VFVGFVFAHEIPDSKFKSDPSFRVGIALSRDQPVNRANKPLCRRGAQAENRTFKEIDMAEQFRVSLRHPVLVFVWGFSLLLIGSFIGMHWHPSQVAILFIAAVGALLMVVHEVFYGFLWISLTAWWIGSRRPGDSGIDKRSPLRW